MHSEDALEERRTVRFKTEPEYPDEGNAAPKLELDGEVWILEEVPEGTNYVDKPPLEYIGSESEDESGESEPEGSESEWESRSYEHQPESPWLTEASESESEASVYVTAEGGVSFRSGRRD